MQVEVEVVAKLKAQLHCSRRFVVSVALQDNVYAYRSPQTAAELRNGARWL